MTGVSAIQYFSISIFKQIGIDSDNALKYQVSCDQNKPHIFWW